MIIAAMTRREKIDNSRSVRQRNGAAMKKRSIDMYGKNHERNEWDGALPFKIKRADVAALSP